MIKNVSELLTVNLRDIVGYCVALIGR